MKLIGTVSELYPKQCKVLVDDSHDFILCSYKRSALIPRDSEIRERSPVAPGDRVAIERSGTNDGVVMELLPRKNALQRRAPDKEGPVVHTIAANVDLLCIVMSAVDPEFNAGLLDRYWVAAIAEDIPAILVLTKLDLDPEGRTTHEANLYRGLNLPIYPVSIDSTSDDLASLQKELMQRTVVFCGQSGVGKTSILSKLSGRDVGRIGEVSAATGKGRHTTTTSRIIPIDTKTLWIDTPGVREFALSEVDPDKLIYCYPEIESLPRDEWPTAPRYESYVRLKASIEEYIKAEGPKYPKRDPRPKKDAPKKKSY
jgi:ribosome biogenesis GTPase / thiamine phosphate phosphatase